MAMVEPWGRFRALDRLPFAKAPAQIAPGTARQGGPGRQWGTGLPPITPLARAPLETLPTALASPLESSRREGHSEALRTAIPRHTENPFPVAVPSLVIVGVFRWFYALSAHTALC